MTNSYLVVDESLETPPYRQIVEQIRSAVERGELQAGMALPPVRQLAGDLRVAPNTVARAYVELQSEGWLVADGRRGTRVASEIARPNENERARSLGDTIERFVVSLQRRGFTREEITRGLSDRLAGGT